MVDRLIEEYDVEVEWRPFDLHPEYPPEGIKGTRYEGEQYKPTKLALQKRAKEAGKEMIFPKWIPNSRRALEASEYAREHDLYNEFHKVVFRKYYGEGQNISEWEVLKSAAEEVGLDGEEMQGKTDNGDYAPVVNFQVLGARELGISGVPAYIFNAKYAVVGAHGYEMFERAMAQIKQDEEEAAEGGD